MASPVWLQKSVRNELYKAIPAVGLDPKDFALESDGDEVRLRHKHSSSYFAIRGGPGQYLGTSVVGEGLPWSHEVYSSTTLIERVGNWLEDVKRDFETPDLWAELQREAELLGAISGGNTENTPFTPDEQNEIAARLRELTERVTRTHSLSAAQMRAIQAQLDYLVGALGRLGRIDWLNVFAGTILSYVLSMALPPESARSIFVGLVRGIGHLYGLPGLPSP